jgi:hypothetical protein
VDRLACWSLTPTAPPTVSELLAMSQTNLIANGVNLMEVRQLVGHKSIGSTVQYIAVSDQQAAQAAKRADAQTF